MASMNVSLPDPMRDYVQSRIDSGHYASVSDYVRDLIRRDQSEVVDEERWLKELDASIEEGLKEMEAGGGHDLDEACDAIIANLRDTADRKQH
ncbi:MULTISPECIES: type II toxin-antitoxin system ParD family antitoxin [Sphingomonadaceae]|uniref:Type II toxin-antitoxin system ParD family antitoxin n=2 Tax=Sphingobium TaxID=165695 RepID=A0A4Q1KE60_9SPHN|nr:MULTISPECIES: type II toxin-antitoxin system ParD family antitoxin [Sphingomonadaceae]PJG45021.1 ParD protein (antitoxin to ParE) [Sphingobium sp. LB126]RXR25176.1 type II toxin-antitoxin system ParD family antitoxin [Sphingobium fluviale]